MPSDDDIHLFCSSLSNGYSSLVEKLCRNPSPSNYEALAENLIAHIIVLNRRRPGEVVNAKMVHYECVLKNDAITKLKNMYLLVKKEKVGKNSVSFMFLAKTPEKYQLFNQINAFCT